jgi:hypothetical protein
LALDEETHGYPEHPDYQEYQDVIDSMAAIVGDSQIVDDIVEWATDALKSAGIL